MDERPTEETDHMARTNMMLRKTRQNKKLSTHGVAIQIKHMLVPRGMLLNRTSRVPRSAVSSGIAQRGRVPFVVSRERAA